VDFSNDVSTEGNSHQQASASENAVPGFCLPLPVLFRNVDFLHIFQFYHI